MIEGKVVDVVGRTFASSNETRVVINRGRDHGVAIGQEFLIYVLGNEVLDPDTGESLGLLEIVHGRGRVQHVQPKMATLVSSETRTETQKSPLMIMFETTRAVTVPFDQALQVGDLVRQLGR